MRRYRIRCGRVGVPLLPITLLALLLPVVSTAGAQDAAGRVVLPGQNPVDIEPDASRGVLAVLQDDAPGGHHLVATAASGAVQWERGYPYLGTPELDVDGNIYVVESEERLLSLTPAGVERWRLDAELIVGDPVVAADGRVHVLADTSQGLMLTSITLAGGIIDEQVAFNSTAHNGAFFELWDTGDGLAATSTAGTSFHSYSGELEFDYAAPRNDFDGARAVGRNGLVALVEQPACETSEGLLITVVSANGVEWQHELPAPSADAYGVCEAYATPNPAHAAITAEGHVIVNRDQYGAMGVSEINGPDPGDILWSTTVPDLIGFQEHLFVAADEAGNVVEVSNYNPSWPEPLYTNHPECEFFVEACWLRVRLYEGGTGTELREQLLYDPDLLSYVGWFATFHDRNAYVLADTRPNNSREMLLLTVELTPVSGHYPNALPPGPAIPGPLARYVAFGDSYSAGQGTGQYEIGTDQGDGGNECRRSSNAYPVLLSQDDIVAADLTFVACSGAVTSDFLVGQYASADPPQEAQFDMANLGPDVSLITLTIGGNDAGFVDILKDCIDGWELLQVDDCADEPEVTQYPVQDALARLGGLPAPHGGASSVIPLPQLFARISYEAPNARVLVLGYPQFFKNNGTLFWNCSGVHSPDQVWINDQMRETNQVLALAASNAGFEFVETSSAFEGHRLCEVGGGEAREWFNDLHFTDLPASFHPDVDGQRVLANLVIRTLQGPPPAEPVSFAGTAEVNQPPIVVLEHEQQGSGIRLDASGSSDSDGVASARWFISAMCGTIAELSGLTVDYEFPVDGHYSVTVQVIDTRGRSGFRGIVGGVSVDVGQAAGLGDLCYSERVGRGGPIEAAVALAQLRYPSAVPGGPPESAPEYVVLARDDEFADALAGAPLTALGPLLFTESTSLSPLTRTELERLIPGGTVLVLGGSSALSDGVVGALEAAGFMPERIAGASRIETALRIADELTGGGPVPAVALARAFGTVGNPTSAWADAITAGAWLAEVARTAEGAAERIPLLLTGTEELHPAVADWLVTHSTTQTTVLGGSAAVSDVVAASVPGPARVAGPDRASTATAIAQNLWEGGEGYVVTNGYHELGWAYGLAAAGLAADNSTPILLSDSASLPPATERLLRDCSVRYGVIVGPPSVVSYGVEGDVGSIIDSCLS